MSETESVPYFDLKARLDPLRAELEEAFSRTLDRASFCLGPDVEAFEGEFARAIGVQHAVGVNSGTSALHLALRLLDAGPGDEVIVPPMTFIATVWAVLYCGAKPVFADIDPASNNLDPKCVAAAITPKTKAVIPVHLYGRPCDMDALAEVCEPHGIPLIEDAAQAHLAEWKGKRAGSIGAVGCFSFYPAKNLGACGEAGALTTNDAAFADRARMLRNHGSPERYVHSDLGYNYRMEGLQGAVLRVQLRHLAEWTEARRRIARLYHERLRDTSVVLPTESDRGRSVWHLYVIRHPQRDELARHLRENRIGCAFHYPLPLHLQPCFREMGGREGDFPHAEALARECLTIPMFPELTEQQIDRVCDVIREFG